MIRGPRLVVLRQIEMKTGREASECDLTDVNNVSSTNKTARLSAPADGGFPKDRRCLLQKSNISHTLDGLSDHDAGTSIQIEYRTFAGIIGDGLPRQ